MVLETRIVGVKIPINIERFAFFKSVKIMLYFHIKTWK